MVVSEGAWWPTTQAATVRNSQVGRAVLSNRKNAPIVTLYRATLKE